MKIFFIVIMLFTISLRAQTLLVPDSSVGIDSYNAKCEVAGYICTQKYFLEQVIASSTPLFDKMMDSLDLSQVIFLDSAPQQIQNLLQQEMLSLNQLEMLIRLLEQINAAQPVSKNKVLLAELNWILKLFTSEPKANLKESDFFIFFKMPISRSHYAKMKSSFLRFPSTEIIFNQIPNSNLPLVEGTCGQSVVHPSLDGPSAKVFSEFNCGWTKGLEKATTSSYQFLNENKSWVVLAAILVGAVIVSNQYQVSFQF